MSRLALPAVRGARALLCLALVCLPAPLAAQDSLSMAEVAARRARLLAMIPDGVAVIMGGEEHPEAVRFRQSPDFFYLTGIEEPGAVLLLNGVTKGAVVFARKSRRSASA
ncbi:MAG: aminopeptidase P N-terminal domain-containing protein [Gemmatimonadales bacterium]